MTITTLDEYKRALQRIAEIHGTSDPTPEQTREKSNLAAQALVYRLVNGCDH